MRKILPIVVVFLVSCVPNPAEQATDGVTQKDGTSTFVASTRSESSEKTAFSTDPNAVIVQYDIQGGLMGAASGTQLPLWTLYGDGLMVWSKDGPTTPGFSSQIWTGHLTEVETLGLITYIDEQGFWNLNSSYQPEPFLEPTLSITEKPDDLSAVMPNPEAALDQPTSVIMVSTNDQHRQVSVFPAGWVEAPDAYKNILDYLLAISPEDAMPFSPVAFSLRAREVPQMESDDQRVTPWPYETIKLSEIANTPMTFEGEQGYDIAAFIVENGQYVIQNDKVFVITLLGVPPR